MDEVLRSIRLKYTYRATNPESYVLHFPNGNVEILLMGAENYTRAAGVSLAWFGIDELDLIEKDLAAKSWKMMVSRLTNGNVMQGFTTSTPEGFNFLHQYFVEDVEIALANGKPLTDRKLIRAKTADNPFIDPEYLATMAANYPPRQLEAYLNGEFVNLHTGAVYPDFNRQNNCTTLTLDDFPNVPLHIGIDFNINKMHSTVAVVKEYRPYVVDELVGSRDTVTLIRDIKARYPNRAIYVYPDASGRNTNHSDSASASDLQLLENAGFDVNVYRKNPKVRDRIAAVNAQIQNGKGHHRLLVNPITCPTLIKSLEQQAYVNGVPDKADDIDHSVDALGYFIYHQWPISKTL
jgi:hypothetical protein